MKTIKKIIQILIVALPFLITFFIFTFGVQRPMNPIVLIYAVILLVFLLFQFGYYGSKFNEWFDSKLK
jgi:ABC-type polysaccharide/polyol phosphate export permease